MWETTVTAYTNNRFYYLPKASEHRIGAAVFDSVSRTQRVKMLLGEIEGGMRETQRISSKDSVSKETHWFIYSTNTYFVPSTEP